MRKGRHILRSNWEDLRASIANVIKEQQISEVNFRALNINEDWKAIEEKIYNTFCKLDHPTTRPIWLWEHFKLDTFSIIIEQPYKVLNKLVDHEEQVWFFVNGDKDKFWFYEGNIKTITTVIEESCDLDELYMVSKKYQWLICINHHDVLYATGQTMPDKLKQLK